MGSGSTLIRAVRERQQVWKIPANGGAEVQVTRKGAFAPLESSDGRFHYYVKRLSATSVWKVPLEGGEETEVLESLSFFANMAVAHDGSISFQHEAPPSVFPLSFSTLSPDFLHFSPTE